MVEVVGKVYKYRNRRNGHEYVGHTSKTIEYRNNQHILSAKKGAQWPFARAIRKYGIESFDLYVIFEHADEAVSLDKEREVIQTENPHYNIHPGGIGGDTFSGQTAQRKKQIRRKQSQTNKKIWANNPKLMERNRRNGKYGIARAIVNKELGTFLGEKNPRSKLTKDNVLKIREMLEVGITQKELAKFYGVSRSVICSIKRRKSWAHI
jgi:group I intron endonuclease